MKKASFILFLAFVLIGSTANAQFNKPLQSASSRVNTSEALYNIGISGGLNSTWPRLLAAAPIPGAHQ